MTGGLARRGEAELREQHRSRGERMDVADRSHGGKVVGFGRGFRQSLFSQESGARAGLLVGGRHLGSSELCSFHEGTAKAVLAFLKTRCVRKRHRRNGDATGVSEARS